MLIGFELLEKLWRTQSTVNSRLYRRVDSSIVAAAHVAFIFVTIVVVPFAVAVVSVMLLLTWSLFLLWFVLLSPLLVGCFVIQDANHREELNKRFQAAVWAAYKREHSVAEDKERDEQVPPAAEAPAAEKKQCNGMSNFLKRHRDAYSDHPYKRKVYKTAGNGCCTSSVSGIEC